MKANQFTALLTIGIGLTSCEMQPAPVPVPEMPYRPRPVTLTEPEPEPEQTATWENTPDATSFISTASTPVSTAAIPDPVVTPEREAASAAAPTLKPASAAPIPEPAAEIRPLDMSSLSAPATPAAPTTPAVTRSSDLSQITNNGPIPTATLVEGDPTRVWNPLDPSKKIRIINPKTNQPYPSGKKLKVRGTNFQFYVP